MTPPELPTRIAFAVAFSLFLSAFVVWRRTNPKRNQRK